MLASADIRTRFNGAASDVRKNNPGAINRSQGVARAFSGPIDPRLPRKDISYFMSITKMPTGIVLKGMQRVEDVLKAIEYDIPTVVLSNHGGRQLDTAPSAIEILAEVMCFGAKGVGIGRPFLYAMSAYGEPGVVRAMQLLKDEFEVGMRLVGAKSMNELGPELVDIRGLGVHSVPMPVDSLSSDIYDRLVLPPFEVKLRS